MKGTGEEKEHGFGCGRFVGRRLLRSQSQVWERHRVKECGSEGLCRLSASVVNGKQRPGCGDCMTGTGDAGVPSEEADMSSGCRGRVVLTQCGEGRAMWWGHIRVQAEEVHEGSIGLRQLITPRRKWRRPSGSTCMELETGQVNSGSPYMLTAILLQVSLPSLCGDGLSLVAPSISGPSS